MVFNLLSVQLSLCLTGSDSEYLCPCPSLTVCGSFFPLCLIVFVRLSLALTALKELYAFIPNVQTVPELFPPLNTELTLMLKYDCLCALKNSSETVDSANVGQELQLA